MEALFESSTQELKEDPSELNAVTNRLLKEAAKEHHPHNRLLPASFIQSLLSHIGPDAILGCNQQGQEYLLAANCIRGILITNFPQLPENKIFRAIVTNYAQTLNAIVRKERQETENCEGATLKYAARGYVLNEIMLKLVQISHVFIPEVLRFTKIIIEIAISHLQLCEAQGETTEKQLRIASKLADNSKIPTNLYKLCSRKVWKKPSFIIFIKFLFEQTKTFLTTCGYSKHALSLQIYRQIISHFQHFKTLLSPTQLSFLSLEQITAQSKQPQNEQVYLQQPLKVRELTPRFYDEEQTVILSKLRKKKQKLTKKIQNDLRKGVVVKQQEAQIREEVRREKGQRQQKKEQLIIERQTVEVKKYNKQIKKVKQSRKGPKNTKNTKNTGRPSPLNNKKGRK